MIAWIDSRHALYPIAKIEHLAASPMSAAPGRVLASHYFLRRPTATISGQAASLIHAETASSTLSAR